MDAQGWYPYGIHRDRWFSGGQPAGLVRDPDDESRDALPPGDMPTPLEPAEPGPADSSATLRADAATRVDQCYDAKKAVGAIVDRVAGQWPTGLPARRAGL
jgi:hypothetical protein